jgi:hypothetical protein
LVILGRKRIRAKRCFFVGDSLGPAAREATKGGTRR